MTLKILNKVFKKVIISVSLQTDTKKVVFKI